MLKTQHRIGWNPMPMLGKMGACSAWAGLDWPAKAANVGMRNL